MPAGVRGFISFHRKRQFSISPEQSEDFTFCVSKIFHSFRTEFNSYYENRKNIFFIANRQEKGLLQNASFAADPFLFQASNSDCSCWCSFR